MREGTLLKRASHRLVSGCLPVCGSGAAKSRCVLGRTPRTEGLVTRALLLEDEGRGRSRGVPWTGVLVTSPLWYLPAQLLTFQLPVRFLEALEFTTTNLSRLDMGNLLEGLLAPSLAER